MPTAIETANTAPTPAISQADSEVRDENDSRGFERERQYQTVMHFVRKLLEEGLISEEEYCQIDTRNLEKWGPKPAVYLAESS